MADSLSLEDIVAMKALLARVIRAEDEKTSIDAQRKELNDRYLESERRRSSAVSAFAAFGFTIADKELWVKVREAMGDAAWFEGFILGGRILQEPEKDEVLKEDGDDAGVGDSKNVDEVSKDADDAGVEETEKIEHEAGVEPSSDSMPTIRQVVMLQLKESGEYGIKASAIREYILRTYGQTVHDKTVGMTLYRLSKDKLSRREGRLWFAGAELAPSDDKIKSTSSQPSVEVNEA